MELREVVTMNGKGLYNDLALMDKCGALLKAITGQAIAN
jgi:hypothetical protein